MNDMNKLNNLLNNDILNINLIKEQINKFTDFDEKQKEEYLNTLLFPEKQFMNAKIPTKIQIPTCSIQRRNKTFITVGEYGSSIIKLNPFFLYCPEALEKNVEGYIPFDDYDPIPDEIYVFRAKYLTSLCQLNVDTTAESDRQWDPIDFDQMLPDSLYDMYRLVSASAKLTFIGPIEDAEGIVGGSIILSKNRMLNGWGTEYWVFEEDEYEMELEEKQLFTRYKEESSLRNISNTNYNKEFKALEGIRMIYFPVDSSFENFYKVIDGTNFKQKKPIIDYQLPEITADGVLKDEFNWYFYIQNSRPNVQHFRLDMCCNFECILKQEAENFLSPEMKYNYLGINDKNEIYKEVQKSCITKVI